MIMALNINCEGNLKMNVGRDMTNISISDHSTLDQSHNRTYINNINQNHNHNHTRNHINQNHNTYHMHQHNNHIHIHNNIDYINTNKNKNKKRKRNKSLEINASFVEPKRIKYNNRKTKTFTTNEISIDNSNNIIMKGSKHNKKNDISIIN
eukprot:468903_1